jgi:GT2 family glycosyltransferase
MSDIAHLIIGPDGHGAVRHAELIARACRHEVIRAARAGDLGSLDRHSVLHVPFTERLFGPTLAAADAAFGLVRERVADARAGLSITVHDVPYDDSPFQLRRRELYRRVMAGARGVVVNSALELSLVQDMARDVHSLRLARLPIEDLAPEVSAAVRQASAAARPATGAPGVTVLGFVYPDRGYEDVIAALPRGCSLRAVGRAAAGHEDLPGRYAAAAGDQWSMTGYVSEEMLSAYVLAAGVPIAPNRRVTASASINTWLAHGRRPLVPDGPYARELAAGRPGCISVYDPADPGALRQAISAALDDPRRTWLGNGTVPGPRVPEVAEIYRAHLAACAPVAPLVLSSGPTVLPGNRWDLLDLHPGRRPAPDVSVIIPYFEAQAQLSRVLAGVARQDYPQSRLDVVVVDDGSRSPPDVGSGAGLRTRLLRQDDQGFRAARARNLGARAAEGEILVFLDGDTVPEPGFVTAISRLPGLCPDVVAVGRRRHADLSGLRPADLGSWWDGQHVLPELTEPAWLSEAYRRTGNLLQVDRRSYRYLISAVLAMHRMMFDEVGGFDERFVGYGGEDWELAYRSYVAGAVFAHVPGAVAWHDGPDWGERADARRVGAKNGETAALSLLLPDPQARGPGQWLPYPSIVVCAPRMGTDALLATARTAFAGGADCGIWLSGTDGIAGADWPEGDIGPYHSLVLADPRLHPGPPAADVLDRAVCVAELRGPADLTELPLLCDLAERHGWIDTPAIAIRSSRALRRSHRWASPADRESLAAALFGRQDRCGPAELGAFDLAAVLGGQDSPS